MNDFTEIRKTYVKIRRPCLMLIIIHRDDRRLSGHVHCARIQQTFPAHNLLQYISRPCILCIIQMCCIIAMIAAERWRWRRGWRCCRSVDFRRFWVEAHDNLLSLWLLYCRLPLNDSVIYIEIVKFASRKQTGTSQIGDGKRMAKQNNEKSTNPQKRVLIVLLIVKKTQKAMR